MKTSIVRALVVTLAVAGFSACSISAKTTHSVNAMPTPLCAPSNPICMGSDND